MPDRGKVLIVDSDASSADELRELLEQEGYVVGRMASGKDALDAISELDANLVMLDAHLPDVNPFELLGEMKASQQARDIPVIFMTTRDDAETRLKSVQSGDDLIVKPFDTHEALARSESLAALVFDAMEYLWADAEPSAVTATHSPSRTSTSGPPMFTMGSMAKTIPGKEEFHETLRYFRRRVELSGLDLRLGGVEGRLRRPKGVLVGLRPPGFGVGISAGGVSFGVSLNTASPSDCPAVETQAATPATTSSITTPIPPPQCAGRLPEPFMA